MVHIIDGANVTAQWYHDDFPGGTVFPHLEKAVLHTTETEGWPGYSGGASAPNVTWHPRLGQVRQHFPNNVSSRALKDPSDTPVRENRDNVWQCEIVAYSDKKLGDSVGGLWIGDLTDAHYTQLATILKQLAIEESLPLNSTVTWKEGAVNFYSGVRLSSAAFDAYRGILGHVHVSGNTHWDPGGFRWSKLAAKLAPTDWLDMATKEDVKDAVREVLAERGITLDWDGSKRSFFEALSFIHFNAADGSFVGTVPETSTRTSHRGRDTFAADVMTGLEEHHAPVEPPTP